MEKIFDQLKSIDEKLSYVCREVCSTPSDDLDISKEKDLVKYLEALKERKDKYLIAIAVKDTIGAWLDDTIQKGLKNIGINEALIGVWERGYIALIDSGETVYEKIGEHNKSLSFSKKYLDFNIFIESRPLKDGNRASVKINDIEFAVSRRGFNFVIIDKRFGNVIDSVAFDTHSARLVCNRKVINHGGVNNINLAVSALYNEEETESDNYYPSRKWDSNHSRRIEDLSVNNLFTISKKRSFHLLWWGSAIFWNVYKSLCKAFADDPSFEITVILYFDSDVEERIKMCNEIGIKRCIRFAEYQIEKERPDIFFLAVIDQPWYKHSFLNSIRSNTNLFIAMPTGEINSYCSTTKQMGSNIVDLNVKYCVDNIILDKFVYNELKGAGCLTKECVELGYPKFDDIYYTLKTKREFPKKWKKIKGKKIFLWCTDHNWDSNLVSFDLYAKEVFSYFANNKEAGLIFRPHRRYIKEFLETGIWKQSDLELFREKFEESDNMIFDETSDFKLAYSLADAIMVDSRTGIMISALTVDVPIAVMNRFDTKQKPYYDNIINEYYYPINGIDECLGFFDMVLQGADPKKDKRSEMFDNSISHYDGKNGKRIKDFIIEQYDSLNFVRKEEKLNNPTENEFEILTFNNYNYLFDSNGVMQTGWQAIDGKKYYFTRTSNVTPKGSMVTGINYIDGKKYYFSDHLITEQEIEIDGKKYYADKDGVLNVFSDNKDK